LKEEHSNPDILRSWSWSTASKDWFF